MRDRHGDGTGTRYAKDGGGNHLSRVREKSAGLGVFVDYRTKSCTSCRQKKPKKGGSNPIRGAWLCADCKGKGES